MQAADELGLHAEPGETAQQLMFRVVTCSKPTGAASRRHLRAPDSGKIDAELINLILPACISISVEDGEMLIDPEMLVGFLGYVLMFCVAHVELDACGRNWQCPCATTH